MARGDRRRYAAVGVHQGLSPVLDVVRDYRWGRVEETIGEDPYLVGVLGAAYVRGLAKLRRHRHFQAFRRILRLPGGPQPCAGLDRRDASCTTSSCRPSRWRCARRRALGDELLRRRGRRSRGGEYGTSDRNPARGVGLQGVVVSDYWAVPSSDDAPGGRRPRRRRGRWRSRAGSTSSCRTPSASGRAGRVVRPVRCRELVDRAARRCSARRRELGLLDAGWTPRAGPAATDSTRTTAP